MWPGPVAHHSCSLCVCLSPKLRGANRPYSAMNGEGGREGGKALGVGRSA